jgi:hypothetical protein
VEFLAPAGPFADWVVRLVDDGFGVAFARRSPVPAHVAGTGRVLDAVNGGSGMTVPSFPGPALERPGVAACRNRRLPRLRENRSR